MLAQIPGANPQIIDYRAIDDEDENKPFKTGKVLLQYDNNQQPPGAAQRQALARIYVDGVAQPDMTWTPLQNQLKRREIEERDDFCQSEPQTSPAPTTLLTTTSSTAIPPAPATGGALCPSDCECFGDAILCS